MEAKNFEEIEASLQLDCDSSDCPNDRLSYSTDGTDLDFVFEDDEPYDEVHTFNLNNNSKSPQPKSIKKKLFDKYRKIMGKQTQQQSNDILTEFDKIFHIKPTTTQGKGQQVQRPISWLFKKKDKQQTKKREQMGQNSIPLEFKQHLKQTQNSSQMKNISAIDFNDENDFELLNQGVKESYKNPDRIEKNVTKKNEEIVTSQTLNEVGVDSQKSINQMEINEQIHTQEQINKPINPIILNEPVYQEQQRIPIFLRTTRYLNSLYPNFLNPNVNKAEQKRKLEHLCKAIQISHQILRQIAMNTINFIKQPKYYNKSMSSLSYFMTSGWQKHSSIEGIEQLRPRNNITFTEIKPNNIEKALNDYQQVIDYYTNSAHKLSLDQQQGPFEEQYKKIRNKLWSVQKNLRFISEDVYKLSLEREHPNYVYWYLNVLKSEMPKKKDQRVINEHKRILGIILANRQRGETLSCSEVGQAVKNKLERQLKFLCPF